ncbi:hypothetical protein [Nonomuraea angiospora]|uniref:hypothetical protein n=1 Tax=Nonomuraea angiospora TaxID=46172 RepID=UPI0029B9BD61|nr:hypothetical protein [Nonomuraea angiospora]MDX3109699.1 hypothetical protein [Nonomuraea angiospora]
MTARLARRRRHDTHGLARPVHRVTRNGLYLVTWFRVDDGFNSHPKQTAASLTAIGLWTVAGSWSAKHLTDGFVPDHQIPSLSRGQVELAKELVRAGLWRRTRGGYQFHEWDADGDGTVRNLKKTEVVTERRKKSSGGRIGNHRRWHEARGISDPDCPYCQGEHRSSDRYSDRGSESGANPPVPSHPKSQSPSGFDSKGVTHSSSLSVGDARATPTDDDLKIDQTIINLLAELTGRTVSPNHAASVRQQILGGRSVKPDKRGNYVLRAIRERPRDFLPAAAPAEKCLIHLLEQPCRSCAADRLAGDP